MAGREGSVAPRERINLTYKTETNGAFEERELQLKLLVVGDFSTPDGTPIEDREAISINKNTFDDVLRDQNLQLAIEVDDVISDERDQKLPVQLSFDSIQSFSPDQIAAQLPELRELLEIRKALKALKGPLGNVREFRERLTAISQDQQAIAEILARVEPSDQTPEAVKPEDPDPQKAPTV